MVVPGLINKIDVKNVTDMKPIVYTQAAVKV